MVFICGEMFPVKHKRQQANISSKDKVAAFINNVLICIRTVVSLVFLLFLHKVL